MISAEIKEVALDGNGNIVVTTEYKKDGVPVQTGNTRYSFGALATQAEIESRINQDIKTHSENLITREYVKTKNTAEWSALGAAVIGGTYEATTGTLKIGGIEYTVTEGVLVSTKPVEIT